MSSQNHGDSEGVPIPKDQIPQTMSVRQRPIKAVPTREDFVAEWKGSLLAKISPDLQTVIYTYWTHYPGYKRISGWPRLKETPYSLLSSFPCQNEQGADPQPYAIAIDESDNFVIADGASGLSVYSRKGEFLGPFGPKGAHPHCNIRDIVFNCEGDLVGIDFGNEVVRVFGPDGAEKFSFGGPPESPFESPFGIDVDKNGTIFVCDSSHNQIQIFDSKGKWLKKFGEGGEGEGQFEYPVGLRVGRDGKIFVCDRGNQRFQVFDSEGKFIRFIGCPGEEDGEFNFPWSMAVDRDGSLIVADSDNGKVQVFSPEGKFLFKLTDPDLQAPKGAILDSKGNIIVTDTLTGKVLIFG